MNARIFFEYAYLAIALYCAYEVYNLWGTADRTQCFGSDVKPDLNIKNND